MNGKRILITGGSGFIGTHLLQALISLEVPVVLSVDIHPPRLGSHRDYWTECDVLDGHNLSGVFKEFKPTHVFHLAAKANLDGQSIADFPENNIGTSNIVQCVNDSNSVERLIHFSTQYVVRPGVWPDRDDFFLPYTPYGASKAEAEKCIRMECNRNWIILRPTNVWGPLHPFFPYELWKYLKLRLYSHPGRKPVIKYYSYIENAIDQIMAVAFGHDDLVCGKVFYITDPPIDNADWMNAFSVSLSGRSIRKMPLAMWKIFAKCGDVLSGFGLRFPMSSERLFRLTVNEQIPIQPTMQLSGNPRVSMEDGVKRSVQWYESMQKGEF